MPENINKKWKPRIIVYSSLMLMVTIVIGSLFAEVRRKSNPGLADTKWNTAATVEGLVSLKKMANENRLLPNGNGISLQKAVQFGKVPGLDASKKGAAGGGEIFDTSSKNEIIIKESAQSTSHGHVTLKSVDHYACQRIALRLFEEKQMHFANGNYWFSSIETRKSKLRFDIESQEEIDRKVSAMCYPDINSEGKLDTLDITLEGL